jgi:hypothetical protein
MADTTVLGEVWKRAEAAFFQTNVAQGITTVTVEVEPEAAVFTFTTVHPTVPLVEVFRRTSDILAQDAIPRRRLGMAFPIFHRGVRHRLTVRGLPQETVCWFRITAADLLPGEPPAVVIGFFTTSRRTVDVQLFRLRVERDGDPSSDGDMWFIYGLYKAGGEILDGPHLWPDSGEITISDNSPWIPLPRTARLFRNWAPDEVALFFLGHDEDGSLACFPNAPAPIGTGIPDSDPQGEQHGERCNVVSASIYERYRLASSNGRTTMPIDSYSGNWGISFYLQGEVVTTVTGGAMASICRRGRRNAASGHCRPWRASSARRSAWPSASRRFRSRSDRRAAGCCSGWLTRCQGGGAGRAGPRSTRRSRAGSWSQWRVRLCISSGWTPRVRFCMGSLASLRQRLIRHDGSSLAAASSGSRPWFHRAMSISTCSPWIETARSPTSASTPLTTAPGASAGMAWAAASAIPWSVPSWTASAFCCWDAARMARSSGERGTAMSMATIGLGIPSAGTPRGGSSPGAKTAPGPRLRCSIPSAVSITSAGMGTVGSRPVRSGPNSDPSIMKSAGHYPHPRRLVCRRQRLC